MEVNLEHVTVSTTALYSFLPTSKYKLIDTVIIHDRYWPCVVRTDLGLCRRIDAIPLMTPFSRAFQ